MSDSVSLAGDASAVPPATIDSRKLAILNGIAVCYQTAMPIMCILAGLLFVAQLLQCWRYRIMPVLTIMLSLVLLLLLNRTAVLVVTDVLVMRGISQLPDYAQYQYPLLLIRQKKSWVSSGSGSLPSE